jgi:thiol-disulfide isomerase/thioredoxin
VALAAVALAAGCTQAVGTQHGAVGSAAPSWSETTTTGAKITMASLAGKPVWLNFFATWCPPCNEEAPSVKAVSEQYASSGLQTVGVDVLENADKAKQFTSKHDLAYPAVVDSGTLRDDYNINGMPVNVFIDKGGIVRKIEVGELTRDEMVADVKAILQ